MPFHMDQPLYIKVNSWLLQEAWVENPMFDLRGKYCVLIGIMALHYNTALLFIGWLCL